MDARQFERVETLFHRSLAMPKGDRDVFIQMESFGDDWLAERVRRMVGFAEAGPPTSALRTVMPNDDLVLEEVDCLIGITIDRYRIVRCLGEGGFGVVYEAEQLHPVTRRVALKILRCGVDSRRVISRFSAERQALALMDHANIARIFDAGQTRPEHGSRPYFVMELVAGEPIVAYCNAHQLDKGDRLALFIDACHAVQHAHHKGVIHRDLKPSNILVTNIDGEAVVKVIDFGIAKAVQHDEASFFERTQVSEAQQMLGTPQYMSPEQADLGVHNVDTRTDVYSLGVVLYELLTGTTPVTFDEFRGATFTRMQQLIRDQSAMRPSTRLARRIARPDGQHFGHQSVAGPQWARLPRDLDWIVLKALEKERERRYHSASALAEDVRRHLAHEPVSAGPPSVVYRGRKFIRRHRLAAAASAVVLLAMIGGLIGVGAGVMRMRTAAEQTTAVNEFMRDLLTTSRSDRLGSEARLVDVLRRGSEIASQRFGEHPETEAQVRDLLGEVYLNLDFNAESTAEFAKSAALWQSVAGSHDRKTIAVELRQVKSLLNQARAREAERVLADLRPRISHVLDADDPLQIEAEKFLAGVHRYRGRLDEAERILRNLRQRIPNSDDAQQTEILTNLLYVQTSRFGSGDHDADLALFRSVQELGIEAAARSERLWGPAAIPTLRSIAIVADMKWRTGDPAAAVALAEEAIERANGKLDPCHTTFLQVKDSLASALHVMGDSSAAAEIMLQRIECIRASAGPEMALLVALADSLPVLDRGERWAEGEAVAREYGAMLRSMGGGHGAMTFSADLYVARFVSHEGRTEEAEQLFAQLFERKSEAAMEDQTTARLHAHYASHLVQQHEFERAESHLLTAVGLLQDVRLGTRAATPDDVLYELVGLYEAWGKPVECEKYARLRAESMEMAAGLR